jgi:hypothetical protein
MTLALGSQGKEGYGRNILGKLFLLNILAKNVCCIHNFWRIFGLCLEVLLPINLLLQ